MYIERAVLKPNLQNIIRDPLPAEGDAVIEVEADSEAQTEVAESAPEGEAEEAEQSVSKLANESLDDNSCIISEILESEQRSETNDSTRGQSSRASSITSSLSSTTELHSSSASLYNLISSPSPSPPPLSSSSFTSPSKNVSDLLRSPSTQQLSDSSKLKLKEEVDHCNGDVELSEVDPQFTDAHSSKESKIDEFLHLYDDLETFEDGSVKEEIENPDAIKCKGSVNDNFGKTK